MAASELLIKNVRKLGPTCSVYIKQIELGNKNRRITASKQTKDIGSQHTYGVKVSCLIDTGADFCVITDTFAGVLGLRAHKIKPVMHISNRPFWCLCYDVKFVFPKFHYSRDLSIIGVDQMPEGYDCILGRDFLEDFDFNYSGKRDVCKLKLSRVLSKSKGTKPYPEYGGQPSGASDSSLRQE